MFDLRFLKGNKILKYINNSRNYFWMSRNKCSITMVYIYIYIYIIHIHRKLCMWILKYVALKIYVSLHMCKYMYIISRNCGLQERQFMYNVPFRPVNATVVADECTKYYIFCVCMYVALVIQHAMHMRHTVMCNLSDRTISCHIIS